MSEQTIPQDLKSLLELVSSLSAENKALRTRVSFLESVLHERVEVTKKKGYQELKHFFDSQRAKVFQIFLDDAEFAATSGFAHEEIIREFTKKYPAIPTTNIPRRVRELVEQKRLWAAIDRASGKVVFRLKLEKVDSQKTDEKE